MKKLFRGIMIIGMMVIIGTAGSSDMGIITASQENIRIIIGLLLIVIGISKGEITEWRR